MMKITPVAEKSGIATVYIAETDNGDTFEFVESLQPPLTREEKWILTLSTLFQCPIGCPMCDASGHYRGKLSKSQLLAQVEHCVRRYYPSMRVPSQKFKIQFARMGEPSLNPAVLDVLRELPTLLDAPGLLPSLSTVAPHGREDFFAQLLEIKEQLYDNGRFQLQFSIHTTDLALRDQLIPIRKWNFAQIADYGQQFYKPGERKITLNFALAQNSPIDPQILKSYFSPDLYLIKITPLNPTYRAHEHQMTSYLQAEHNAATDPLIDKLRDVGFEVIVSIGEIIENQIGSNCGQYIERHRKSSSQLVDGYADCTTT